MARDTDCRSVDDLALVTGMTAELQNLLRESVGVQTYFDLGNLSTESVAALTSNAGMVMPKRNIRHMLAHARQLAAAKVFTPETGCRPSVPLMQGLSATDWNIIASYVVEYQRRQRPEGGMEWCTSVHHVEADDTITWSGLQTHAVCRWMIAHMGTKKFGDYS